VAAPVFRANDRPADVLDGAGRWLAASLPGFRWVKSRHDLERNSAGQVQRVRLQSSKWSSAGVATWVSAELIVRDDRLLRWRRQNPEFSSVPDPHHWDPTVFDSLFINFLKACWRFEASGLPLSPDDRNALTLGEFLHCMTEHVLPVLDDFLDPSTLVFGLPAPWWDMIDVSAVEWSLACGDRDSAAAMIHRHLERPLRGDSAEYRLSQFREGWEAARCGERAANAFSIAGLGWLSGAHGLVEPDAIRPPGTHEQ
jgi:hypothetical protein